MGLLPVALGVHSFQRVASARPAWQATTGLVDDLQYAGTHVHVQLSDPQQRRTVYNLIRGDIYSLAALACASAVMDARVTLYKSARMMALLENAPPVLEVDTNSGERSGARDEDVRNGDLRLSPRYPTIELTALDSNFDQEIVNACALLFRAMVTTATEQTPRSSPLNAGCARNLRGVAEDAARNGVGDRLYDPATNTMSPARRCLQGPFIDRYGSALESRGDLELVTRTIDRVLTEGTTADRQIRLFDALAPKGPRAAAEAIAQLAAAETLRPVRGLHSRPLG